MCVCEREPSLGSSSLPGTTGTPAAIAAARAEVLSANVLRFSIFGPTNVIPASAHLRMCVEREREGAAEARVCFVLAL